MLLANAMYPEDSVMCCLFPDKCNMFHLTPGVIFWDVMWYLNMTFVTCSLVLMVWGILRILLQRYACNEASAMRCRSSSKILSCSKSTNSSGRGTDDDNNYYDDERGDYSHIDFQTNNYERYCNSSHDLDVCPLIDGEIFSTVRVDGFVQMIKRNSKKH